MNPESMIEYNTLSWVKSQLDDVLSAAQSCLSEYIENKAEEHLEKCIEHLKLIHGTLQMVEVFGASMLAEEMQHTTEALLARKVADVDDTYDVLMRAILQLPDYLETIQAGRKDNPISLMPLMNDLRAVRKQSLLTEGVLFSPDIENTELVSGDYDVAAIKPGRLQGEAKRLRTHYQLGLLDYIRSNKESVGLQRIRAVLTSLEKVSSNAEVRRIWMVAGALVEGLIKKGIEKNSSVEMLLGSVDRQLKLLIEHGEKEFPDRYSKELVSNALFYVGLSTVETKLISAVRNAYHLSDLMQYEAADANIAISGLNADLFDTVSNGIAEDMEQVKDVLELFMHSSDKNTEQLVPVAEQIAKVADTYGMLGLAAVRQSLMAQQEVLHSIINGEVEASEQVVLGIASEVLTAESELKDYIAERSGRIGLSSNAHEQRVPAAEYRQVVSTVASEALKNFSEAKIAILSFVSGNGDKEQLDLILNRLEEVRGITMLLPLGRVEDQIKKLQGFIRIALLKNNHKVTEEEQDAIADAVTSIEYFIESLLEGRPGVEQALNAGDEAASKLEQKTRFYQGDVYDAARDDEVNTEVDDSKLATAEVVELAIVKPQATEAEADDLTHEGEQYAVLANDADEEIVEIFIEEAEEVLAEMREYYPQWKADANNAEALAVVRRGFHTLKGSGRLLGAEMIGEFSWKYENMLNRLIENKINVSENLYEALDNALAAIPGLIEQIKGNTETIDNITQLMATADAITEGRDVIYDVIEDAPGSKADLDESINPAEEHQAQEAIDNSEPVNYAEVSDEIIVTEGAGYDADEMVLEDNISIDEIEFDESETLDIDFIDMAAGDDETGTAADDNLEATLDMGEELVASAPDVIEIDENELLIDPDNTVEHLVFETAGEDIPELEITINEIDAVNQDSEELIDIQTVNETDHDRAEDTDIVNAYAGEINIDPVLLKIYYDESVGHIETVKQLLDECEIESQPLKADKTLLRAFHTLYGSARTAEVEPIADLAGATEKYIKARQDAGEEFIADDVVVAISEVEQAISSMLELVADGKLPDSEKTLHEKINYIVERELNAQQQKSAQNEADIADNIISIDSGDLQAENDKDLVQQAEADNKPRSNQQQQSEEDSIHVSYGDIDDELIDIFLEEASELLESSEDTLGKIKNEPNATEYIHQLQRNMHTLKGGARMADLMPVGDLTHNLESLVDMVNDNKVNVDDACFNLLQDSLDVLTSMLVAVRNRQPLPVAGGLINRIEKLIHGETEEKDSVAYSDADKAELKAVEDVKLEEIELSDLSTKVEIDSGSEPAIGIELEKSDKQEELVLQAVEADLEVEKEVEHKDRPHWGERVTDVNFKETQEQVRVRADLLNNLVNYAGEVNIFHARMGKQIADFSFNLSELSQTVVRLKEQLRKLEIETEIQIRSGYEKEIENIDDNFDPLEMDQYSTLQQLTRSLSETAGDVDSINEILANITRDSETLLVQESRISSDLQEGLMRTRMVRFGGLSSRLRRIVRQVSRELGKEVEIEILGENCEVDRTVLDRIIAPLEHMLRNAVAHGIEAPEARKILGKNETGKIVIQVDRQGSDVVIKVNDDGAGINADKIRKKAINKGMVADDSILSDRDALQLILHSGFTTADEVTQVAGRGVGMDVVDSEIKQLGGILEIDTVRGRGTEFTIRLPLTLAINQALLVSAAEDVYAIPLPSIEGVVRVTGVELQQIYNSGNSQYEFNGVEYELRHLGALLTGNQLNYSKQLKLFPVLLVHVGDKRFALHVEDLVGRREIVVKPVGLQIGSVHGIAGASILADGRVVLILEMSALAVADSLFKSNISSKVTSKDVDDLKTIMVVDDSITIRKITERILRRYGIEVVLAKDGVDATNLLQESVPDLILLDIEMPRMDGFEVASFVRNDNRLKNIPIIMITSRTGSKHKEKAMEIGVNQYLGKPFQEDELMKNINKILKTSFSLT